MRSHNLAHGLAPEPGGQARPIISVTLAPLVHWLLQTPHIREVLMGVGDGVASVIMLTFIRGPASMLTFTKRSGPHADTAWVVVG